MRMHTFTFSTSVMVLAKNELSNDQVADMVLSNFKLDPKNPNRRKAKIYDIEDLEYDPTDEVESSLEFKDVANGL